MPTIAYLGEALPRNFNLQQFTTLAEKPLAFGTLDIDNQLTMHPQAADGFMGHTAMLSTSHVGGKFTFVKCRQQKNKITFICQDKLRLLELHLVCELHNDTGVLIFHSQIKNCGKNSFVVDWLASCTLPIVAHFDEYINFNGSWCGEFEMSRQKINFGQHIIENKRGRTSHESSPCLIALTKHTSQNNGKCLGAHFGWSGNHKIILEKLKNGLCQLQLGLYVWPNEIQLKHGEVFSSPKTYASFSQNGLNGLSNNFYAFLRREILHLPNKKPRPITFNSWEAIYFKHNIKKLRQLADSAAELGVERFVLDDGWFLNRNDDSRALGDWLVDEKKYPNGLGEIVNYVRSKNMEFGLWIEPEMVNKNSRLYKKHPDWIINLANTKPITGRQQFVLDLTKKSVQNYLQKSISRLLSKYPISYLKWDMNRDHTMPFCQKTGKAISYKLTCSFYQLIDKIKHDFPHLEIESCASGGGRIDFEILKRTQRVWPSDSNDPIERIKIHHALSHFLPPEIIGAHIGAKNCHTSGRLVAEKFAALVCQPFHFGLELDLANLTANELANIQQAILFHKQNRKLWHGSKFLRLQSVDENQLGFACIASNKKLAQIIIYQLDRAATTIPAPLQIPAQTFDLRPGNYKIKIIGGELKANRKFNNKEIILSKFAIENIGIQLPILYANSALVLELQKI